MCSPRLVSVSGMFWLSSDHCPAMVGRNMNTSRLMERVELVATFVEHSLVQSSRIVTDCLQPTTCSVSQVVRFETNPTQHETSEIGR